jgi:hypothetical protein
MMLAGIRVPDEDVRELARLVDEPTRSILEKALAFEAEVVALTIADRERILWALDDARTADLDERGRIDGSHQSPRTARDGFTSCGVRIAAASAFQPARWRGTPHVVNE